MFAADINLVIMEALSFMDDDVVRQNIEIAMDLQPELPAVKIDHIQVEQVIINLIRNALEAMNSSNAQENKLSIQTRSLDNEVIITITDNGPGLPDAEESIFDPFITSKENGLGLGLSISRSIVEAHGGSLRISSKKDSGAALTFTLLIEESTDAYSGEIQ